MFKYDPNSTIHQGRWRLKDPALFETFWTTKDKKEQGISYIKGKLKKSDGVSTQAIRFDKKLWTEKAAAKWWKKNRKRFIKTWMVNDWKQWLRRNSTQLFKIAYLITAKYRPN